jgi:hypothetical protein
MSYANIHSQIAVSEDWADLVKADPLAAVIYSMMWPACSAYATLPGLEVALRGLVCPRLHLTDRRFHQALALLVERGFVLLYSADGHAFAYLPKYHKFNCPRQWDRIGQPPHPLPPNWMAPENLIEFCSEEPTDKHQRSGAWRYFQSHPSLLQDHSETPLGVGQEHSERAPLSPSPSDAVKDLVSEPPSALPPPQVGKRKTTLSPEEIMGQGDAILSALASALRLPVETYLAAAAAENATRKITPGRRLTLLSELQTAREKLADDDALLYGLQAANAKGVANVNYVKKAAASYDPGKNNGGGRLEEPSVRDPYLHPEGVGFGPAIDRLKGPWVEWVLAVPPAERKSRWERMGAAIRAADVDKDFSQLEAGPPAGGIA